MSRPKNPRPSELLFDERPPSHKRAFELVARIPIGSSLIKEKVNGSGPYWYARTPMRDGKAGKRRYVGSDQKKRELEAAWAMVAEELAKADAEAAALPQVQKLRELEALAGKRRPGIASASDGVAQIDVRDIRSIGGNSRPK